jgi:hypothetical protein
MAKQQAENQNQGFIDELMGFDPTQVAAFNEPEQKSNQNQNLYKTNPLKTSKDVAPDGHYHAKIRIIYNPHDMAQSIINNAHYAMYDANGFFMVDSKLAFGDRNCFMFKAWKTLHFNESTDKIEIDGKQYTRKEWGDHMFDKSEERFCLVQVIEDANQPDKVGKFLAWRLPKVIYEILQAKMRPTDKSKAPQDLMNYLFGPVLELDVTPGPDDAAKPERKQREIGYNLCSFEADPTPIVSVTGEELFDDDERDMIADYAAAKKVLTDPKATTKKKDEAVAKCKSLVDPLKALMQKAIDYVKENAINIVDEFGYHEPNPELKARADKWIDIVVNKLKNPQTYVEAEEESGEGEAPKTTKPSKKAPKEEPETPAENPADDLPF